MTPAQPTTWRVAAPQIIVIMFTMTAMVGNRLPQIKVPRLDAYIAAAYAAVQRMQAVLKA